MLFDSHTHLDSSRFDKDRDKVIQRMRKNGVTHAIIPGTCFESSVEAIELAQRYEGIYATVGFHPCAAKYADDMSLSLLKAMARKPKVVAIGEIGLDYYHDKSPKDVQIRRFIDQIDIAKAVKLPIVIHDRDANDDVFEILNAEKAFDTGVLFHCYSGNATLARKYVKLGAKLSIAGPVTYNGATKLHEVVKAIPLEHLLIETDAPSLTPHPYRGKRNEPGKVKLIAERIAELKGISLEEVAEVTMKNTKKFFRIE